MKKVFRYVLLAASIFSAIVLGSCDKDETQVIPEDSIAYFPLGNEVGVHPLGDTLYVSFTSEFDWSIDKSQCNWVNFSKTSGLKGTTEIIITVDKNNSSDGQRQEGNVYFNRSDYGRIQSVRFYQDALCLEVLDSNGDPIENCSFGWKSSSQSIKVKSNVLWEANFVDSDGNLIDENELSVFSKDFKNGVNVGKSGDTIVNELKLHALTHNFSADSNKVTLRIVPVKVKSNKEVGDYKEETRIIEVSQDNLIFVVSSEDEPSEVEKENYTNDLELYGFTELGSEYVKEGYVNGNDHLTEQTFYVMEEVDEDGNRLVEWDFGDFQTDFVFKSEPSVESITELNGRRVKVTSYNVALTQPNPILDTTEYILPLHIKVEGKVDPENERARRLVKLLQKPYVWNISVGSLLAQEGDTTAIKITTTGPWKIELPESSSWWNAHNSQWEGIGDYEIYFSTSEWNLDLDNDKIAYFNFSNECNSLTASVPLKKEHFHFNIGHNMVTEMKTSREMLSELRKKDLTPYDVLIDCSGEWTVDYLNVPEWVSISNLDDNMEKVGNHNFVIGASEKNSLSYDREAMIVFTSKTHASYNKVVKDTLLLRQMKHIFGWEPDQWSEDVKQQNCNHPAYIVSDGKVYTFGFGTTFSDDWTLSSDASWVKFHLGDDVYNKSSSISGTGESNDEQYVYVTVDNNFNITEGGRQATVTVQDRYTNQSKSFQIRQDAFVFDVVSGEAFNNIDPLDTSEKNIYVTVTKGAPWSLNIGGNNPELIYSYTQEGENPNIGSGTKQTVKFNPAAVEDVNLGNREAVITVSVDGSTLGKDITVKQKEYAFRLDKYSLQNFHEITKSTQTVNVTCSGDWNVTNSNTKDFTVTKDGGKILVVQNGVNTSLDSDLTASITIKTNDMIGGEQKSIMLDAVQNNYVFSAVVEGSNSFAPKDDASKSSSVKVQASAGWSYTSSNTTDFNVTKNTDKIIVKPKGKNYQTQDKQVTLTIKSDHNHTKSVNFSQTKYIFETGTFADKSGINEKGETITFTGLQCTGALDFEIKPVNNSNWLDKANVSIVNGNQMTIVVPANTGSERKVQIRLFSKDENMNPALTKTITLTQKKK